MRKLHLILILLSFFSVSSFSQLSVSGITFGDYFYKVSGDSTSERTEYSLYPQDHQAFDIRRIYLGFNYSISEKVAANILLESGNKILTSGRYGLFVKMANVELKNVIPNSSIYIGIAPTFSYALTEKYWNYRSIEKTITDMRGFTSASDLGVGLRGNFGKSPDYGYSFMIGNGSYQRPEFDKYKRFYLDFYGMPVNGLLVELYTDVENRTKDRVKWLYKSTIAYQQKRFTVGVEAFQQNQFSAAIYNNDTIDVKPTGISFFGWANILGSVPEKYPKLNLFARYDYYDPNTTIDDIGFKENFISGGLDFEVYRDVHLMPNVWINTYKDKSPANIERTSDVVARLTFFYLYR